ncbi:hypothetical protein O6H91_04G060900 [Diphasiastrum complanatum]|uniref:Uncharacterized protein n=1 Tax=Diphasiastrum complanatum TaxID=34168 RepID=A0ACC2DXI0_DIPCM|nr:hypothetical protein O6H91_04G060900 [Diphasiastrum complanatum]
MALQWVILGAVTAFEALLVLVLTLPLPRPIKFQVVRLVSSLLQPLLALIPFAIFTLLDIYWKYENVTKCTSDICTAYEKNHYEKFRYKAQRNTVLGLGACLLYWLLYSLTQFHYELKQLEDRLRNLKED